MNITMLLDMAAGAAPDRVAVGSHRSGMTYAALLDASARAGRWLTEQDVPRVLYADLTAVELPVVLFGAAWAARPCVPLSFRLADDRLRALVERQAPAALVCSADVADRIGAVDGVQVVDRPQLFPFLDAFAPAADGWAEDPEAAAVLLHTSGTTGEPKVAVIKHTNLVSYVLGTCDFLAAPEDEATLVSVPPYHIAGMAAILTAVFSGRRLVQLPVFEPSDWVALAEAEEVTHAMVVPTMLARILEVLPDTGGLPHLRHLSYGGGRMPQQVIEQAMDALPHVEFVNAYGLTETSSSIAVLTAEDHCAARSSADPLVRRRLGSVGRPLPSVEISVRDASGDPVSPRERGEVWVRGEQVSGEYLNTSSHAPGGGWFATRDAGWFDEGGYLFVEGRLDDVIIRGGENLSPSEIEDVLVEHPAVREAAVVGIPDVEWGEVVAAAVVVEHEEDVSSEVLREWVGQRLRSARTPSVVEVWSELPYNETGKLLRRVVKEQLGRVRT